MSKGIGSAAVRKAMFALGIAAILTAVARAADPNAAAEKGKATAAVQPTEKPKPPAARNPALFTAQMPFSEAIDILRHSTVPPLNIVVLWKHLAAAGVDRDTPIGIDGVPGLRVGQYLDLLTLSLSSGASVKLGCVVNGGVVTVSTTDALPTPKAVTRVYDVSDLVAPPARYAPATMGFGWGYGAPTLPFSGYAGNPSAGPYAFSPAGGLLNPVGASSAGRTARAPNNP
ncbi:MAG: hypothetical protein MUC88_04655 [Planctomycetes bacterium]|jgi:hypothetical protein|nr:hypothetical protein [Planctomycetota bacterium]